MVKTPNQKWTEEISGYKKKCQRILSLSKSIRYVGLINPYGRTLTGIVRPTAELLLKSGSARDEFFLMSTLFNMRNKISSALGTLDYAMFKHNKVTLIMFQGKEGVYYISISKNVTPHSLAKLIDKIKKIV